MITVRFECGHVLSTSDTNAVPVCGCGERKISSVSAPPPVFRGHASGPHATFENLPAKAVVFGKSQG
jgi:hypothetical protein